MSQSPDWGGKELASLRRPTPWTLRDCRSRLSWFPLNKSGAWVEAPSTSCLPFLTGEPSFGNRKALSIMTMIELEVIAGIDTHADTHHVAVIDTTGRRLGDAGFSTTLKGYKAIAAYIAAFGLVRRVGVEGTHSYGAGITQHLKDSGVRVVEVIRPNRQVRRMQGKQIRSTPMQPHQRLWPPTIIRNRNNSTVSSRPPATSTQRAAVRSKHELPLAFRSKVCWSPHPSRFGPGTEVPPTRHCSPPWPARGRHRKRTCSPAQSCRR